MGLSNIFAHPRTRKIGGSLGTMGRLNRPTNMMAPLYAQRAYPNSKKLELGFERVGMMQMRACPLTNT